MRVAEIANPNPRIEAPQPAWMAFLELWLRQDGFPLTVWNLAVTVAVAVGLRQSPASAVPGWNEAGLDRAFTYAARVNSYCHASSPRCCE